MKTIDKNEKAVKYWSRGESFTAKPVHTANGHLFHYDTMIATWNRDHNVVIVNDTQYSKHTRKLQTFLKEFLDANKFAYACVTGVKISASASTLVFEYTAQIAAWQRIELES